MKREKTRRKKLQEVFKLAREIEDFNLQHSIHNTETSNKSNLNYYNSHTFKNTKNSTKTCFSPQEREEKKKERKNIPFSSPRNQQHAQQHPLKFEKQAKNRNSKQWTTRVVLCNPSNQEKHGNKFSFSSTRCSPFLLTFQQRNQPPTPPMSSIEESISWSAESTLTAIPESKKMRHSVCNKHTLHSTNNFTFSLPQTQGKHKYTKKEMSNISRNEMRKKSKNICDINITQDSEHTMRLFGINIPIKREPELTLNSFNTHNELNPQSYEEWTQAEEERVKTQKLFLLLFFPFFSLLFLSFPSLFP